MCVALRWARLIVYAVLLAALVVFLILDTVDNRQRLVSLVGVALLTFFGFVFSAAPRAVNWRHVIWGLALQFILGLLILRYISITLHSSFLSELLAVVVALRIDV